MENKESSTISFLSQFVEDIDFTLWLYRTVWYPLLATFLLPLVFVILIYFSCITLYIFKFHSWLLLKEIKADDTNFWRVAIKFIAAVWDAHATLYHGYEILGLENLPKDGPGLIIYYHGAIPIDMYYFVAKMYLKYDRLIYTVGDRFLFKYVPGWSIIAQALKVSPGTVKSCVEALNREFVPGSVSRYENQKYETNLPYFTLGDSLILHFRHFSLYLNAHLGNLMSISPGGVYEAQFGNNYYELLWQQRLGFAKVAIESKAPIIPMFTENIREGFRNIGIGRRFFTKIYNWTRLPIRPIYGGFPVKFRTHLGPPIYYEEGITPKELQEKVAAAIEKLIVENQRIPGSIVGGLLDRIFEKRKIDIVVNSARQKKFIHNKDF